MLQARRRASARACSRPGSRSTLADLARLRARGLAAAIVAAAREGRAVRGVCGGYRPFAVGACPEGVTCGAVAGALDLAL